MLRIKKSKLQKNFLIHFLIPNRIKDKQKWCYDTAANYFSNNKIFFEKFWNRNELGSGIA